MFLFLNSYKFNNSSINQTILLSGFISLIGVYFDYLLLMKGYWIFPFVLFLCKIPALFNSSKYLIHLIKEKFSSAVLPVEEENIEEELERWENINRELDRQMEESQRRLNMPLEEKQANVFNEIDLEMIRMRKAAIENAKNIMATYGDEKEVEPHRPLRKNF